MTTGERKRERERELCNSNISHVTGPRQSFLPFPPPVVYAFPLAAGGGGGGYRLLNEYQKVGKVNERTNDRNNLILARPPACLPATDNTRRWDNTQEFGRQKRWNGNKIWKWKRTHRGRYSTVSISSKRFWRVKMECWPPSKVIKIVFFFFKPFSPFSYILYSRPGGYCHINRPILKMVGRGLHDRGGCLCVFFIPARHGAERTRSGAFLPPRRDAVSLSLFLFLLSTPFCRVDLYSNLSRQSRKEKKGATFYMRTGSCYVYSITFLSVRLLF